MAELIRKDKLIDWTYREPNYYDSINDRTDMRDFIREMQTTTEAEIRAKAISEFAEKLKAELSGQIFSDEEKFKYDRRTQEAICAQNATWKVAIQYVEKLADQLKERD